MPETFIVIFPRPLMRLNKVPADKYLLHQGLLQVPKYGQSGIACCSMNLHEYTNVHVHEGGWLSVSVDPSQALRAPWFDETSMGHPWIRTHLGHVQSRRETGSSHTPRT